MIALALALTAHAAPGVLLHGTGATPAQEGSSVTIVAYDGDTAWVTTKLDLHTMPTRVGLLVPVPAGFDPADVRKPDDTLDHVLDDHTTPDLLPFVCDTDTVAWDAELGDGGAWEDDAATATPQWIDNALQIEVGTPADVDAAEAWLGGLGLELPDGSADLLAPYLAAGDALLLAWRDTTAAGEYRSAPAVQYPVPAGAVRLDMALSAPSAAGDRGDTDTVYVLAPADGGQAAIRDQDLAELDEACLWIPDGDITLAEELEERRAEAADDLRGAGYLRDHAALDGALWTTSSRDVPTADQLATWGYGVDQGAYFLTRLTVAAHQDLTVELTGDDTAALPRYALHDDALLAALPVCFDGWYDPEGPACTEQAPAPDDTGPVDTSDTGYDASSPTDTGTAAPKGDCGCAAGTGAGGGAWLAALGLLGWRRRGQRR